MFVSILVSLFFAGLGLVAVASLAHSLRNVAAIGKELAGQYRADCEASLCVSAEVVPMRSRPRLRARAKRCPALRPALRAAA